jgi:hypothetical protein
MQINGVDTIVGDRRARSILSYGKDGAEQETKHHRQLH